MAPIALGLTSIIPGGSAPLDATDSRGAAPSQVVYHVPPASQAPAAPSDATQQDTVTLSGKAPATRSQTASQNFVPAAALTSLAHEFTFPPNDSENGANGTGTANSNSAAPSVDQTGVAQEPLPAPILTQRAVNATRVAVAAKAAQTATGTNPANAAANSANSAAATRATAPEETLQQLDQELQRLGINPQDISLMNRMSLLLWVNDPVALRQFVQGMQPWAMNSETNSATDALNARANSTQLGAGGTNVNQGAGASGVQSEAQGPVQNQSAVTSQDQSQVAPQKPNQNSSSLQSSGIGGGGTDSSANVPPTANGRRTAAASAIGHVTRRGPRRARCLHEWPELAKATAVRKRFGVTHLLRPGEKLFILNHTPGRQSVVSLPHRR
ncbi:MAG: hypothetical protein WBY69_04955 [Candidatus Acidiferrales bacterium]